MTTLSFHCYSQMVPENEWEIADKITDKIIEDSIDDESLRNKITQLRPKNWLASWRFNRKWRRINTIEESWQNKKPIVCFTGKNPNNPTKTRSEYLAETKDRGFQTVNRFSQSVQIVVSGNPLANTEKNRMAVALDLPVITYDEWDRLTPDGKIVE